MTSYNALFNNNIHRKYRQTIKCSWNLTDYHFKTTYFLYMYMIQSSSAYMYFKNFFLPVHAWKKSLNWKYKHLKYNLFLLTIFTNLSSPALLAGAPEWPNGISTAASVKTRIVQALILVCHDKKYIQFKKWTQAFKR